MRIGRKKAKMKVLVACEESQAVTKELRALGHMAFSCDIVECSGGKPEWHIHPYTKKTRLWLRGLPPLVPTDVCEPVGPYVPAGTSRKDRSKYGSAKRGEDAKNRSKTFPGIAKAMAEQWAGET